jgi:hypothetical protein
VEFGRVLLLMTIAKSIFCLLFGIWIFSLSHWFFSPSSGHAIGTTFEKPALECVNKVISGDIEKLDNNVGAATSTDTNKKVLKQIHLASKICLSQERDLEERARLELIRDEAFASICNQNWMHMTAKFIAIVFALVLVTMIGVIDDYEGWDT